MLVSTMLLYAPSSLESALDTLLTTLVSQSSTFIGLGQAVGGLGAMCYIFYRVWGHLARNEEIDVYPLFRPAALAICILFYDQIAGSIVTMSQKLNESTMTFVVAKQAQVQALTKQKKDIITDQGFKLKSTGDFNGDGKIDSFTEGVTAALTVVPDMVTSGLSYAMSKLFDDMLMALGEVLYNFASIAIKFLQTFFLLIMLITGPLTFGLGCFDWFYNGLATWVARVIHLLLWLPLANILAGMLEQVHISMLQTDILQLQSTSADTFSGVDIGLIVFYLLGTAGYFCVPQAASYIIESSGAGGALASLQSGGKMGGAAVGGAVGAATGGTSAIIKRVKQARAKSNSV